MQGSAAVPQHGSAQCSKPMTSSRCSLVSFSIHSQAEGQALAPDAAPGQPSKAALKRARKKAAAAAAAQAADNTAAQPPMVPAAAATQSAAGSLAGAVLHGGTGAAAGAVQTASHSEAGAAAQLAHLPGADCRDPAQIVNTAEPAAPRSGAGCGLGASCQVSDAADSLQGLQLHNSDAVADGNGSAANEAWSWMHCPLSKVCSTFRISDLCFVWSQLVLYRQTTIWIRRPHLRDATPSPALRSCGITMYGRQAT